MTKNKNPKGNRRFQSKDKKRKLRGESKKKSSELRRIEKSHATIKKDPIKKYDETGVPIGDNKTNVMNKEKLKSKIQSKKKSIQDTGGNLYGK